MTQTRLCAAVLLATALLAGPAAAATYGFARLSLSDLVFSGGGYVIDDNSGSSLAFSLAEYGG